MGAVLEGSVRQCPKMATKSVSLTADTKFGQSLPPHTGAQQTYPWRKIKLERAS